MPLISTCRCHRTELLNLRALAPYGCQIQKHKWYRIQTHWHVDAIGASYSIGVYVSHVQTQLRTNMYAFAHEMRQRAMLRRSPFRLNLTALWAPPRSGSHPHACRSVLGWASNISSFSSTDVHTLQICSICCKISCISPSANGTSTRRSRARGRFPQGCEEFTT